VLQRYVVLSETGGTRCFFPCEKIIVSLNRNREQSNVNLLHKHANNRLCILCKKTPTNLLLCLLYCSVSSYSYLGHLAQLQRFGVKPTSFCYDYWKGKMWFWKVRDLSLPRRNILTL
jgi:hypothetical protein